MADDRSTSKDRPTTAGRQWLGVLFRCCHQYGRMYKDQSGARYAGRCPRCGTEVTAKVGEGGTDQRFFQTR